MPTIMQQMITMTVLLTVCLRVGHWTFFSSLLLVSLDVLFLIGFRGLVGSLVGGLLELLVFRHSV